MRLLGLAVLLSACNGYATLEGTLTAPAQNARVAVVWKTPDGVEIDGDVAMDDTSFALSLTKVPSLRPSPCGGEAAAGALIAYEDADGNGRFSISTPDQPSADRVLGAATNESLLYARGLQTFDPARADDGFHRVALECFGAVYLPDDAPLTITVGDTAAGQSPCDALFALDASAATTALACTR